MAEWTKQDFDRYYRGGVERWGYPNTRDEIQLGYAWCKIIAPQAGISLWGLNSPNYPQLIFDILSLRRGDGLILIGAGFNGTGLGLNRLGVRVIGTDISPYILSEKDQTEEASIREACLKAGVDPDNDLIIGPPGNVKVNPLDLFMEGGRVSPKPRGKEEVLGEDLRNRGSRNSVSGRLNRRWATASVRYIVTEEVINSIPDEEAAEVCDYCSAAALEWGATVAHMVRCGNRPDTGEMEGLNWKTYAQWRNWLNTNQYVNHKIIPTVDSPNEGIEMYERLL